MSVPVDAAVQQEPEPVVGEVAETVADALDFLDEQVHRFGAPVADAAGVEVGEQLTSPGVDGAGEAVQLGDIRVGAVNQPPIQPLLGLGAIGRAVDRLYAAKRGSRPRSGVGR